MWLMASVLLYKNTIVFTSRSISKSSRSISSPRIVLSNLNQLARMSSASSSDMGEEPDARHVNSAVINRPSIIKSVVSSNPATVQPMQRPSVICSVKKSVLVENKAPPIATEVIKINEEKTEPAVMVAVPIQKDVVDLSSAVKPATDDTVSESSELKADEGDTEDKLPRVKTRKFVLMLSYSGTGYFGMQRNPGTKTIEDDLFQALMKNNYIDEESYNRPQLINFQRAARTDKGVSAARQIVSIKLPENATIENMNQYLPKQIRVQGMKRVTKGFDSKNSCDARTYSYMMPTFAFVPVTEQVTESYRITPEVLENVRQKFASYVGLKDFHNFTSRKKPGDPSAKRIIMSFTCSDPFIQDGLEFVILRVKGQSFMMHQIRKMVGLATAIVRGFASNEVMELAFSMKRIDIPRAPGLGLMLDQVHYERYDKKFGADGCHDPLTWDDVQTQIEQFCDEYIYSNVTKIENEEKSMFHWLETLAFHTYDEREHEPLKVDGKIVNLSESFIGKAWRAAVEAKGGEKGSSDDEGGDDDEEIPSSKKAKLGA